MVDDYSDIQSRCFADLHHQGAVDADPSGWLTTYSEAESLLQLPTMVKRDFAHYYIDEGTALRVEKESVAELLTAWENRPFSIDDFTICPSGASASLVVLATLKALGVNRVLIETPCYFATIEQAEQIALNIELIPTYFVDGYRLPDFLQRERASRPLAIWLTQPRASLGFNQSHEVINRILEELGHGDFLVVDEVTDQSFPATLGRITSRQDRGRLVRIRSFTKAMGLNGFRLAVLIHPTSLREPIVSSLETFGGALDVHSLKTVMAFSEDLPRFKAMLNAANEQVNSLRAKAERLVLNTPLFVNHLTNGYIGSLVADLSDLGRTQKQRRARFLQGCQRMRTPVMLGASSYMAKDPPKEGVRLNFFMQPEHITRGISNLLQIWG
jgi:histidinol-phosphate/aromatic aminotransferase/cobyric acid decarboxylase-like protein